MSSEDGTVFSASAAPSDTSIGDGGSTNRQSPSATPVANNKVSHGFRMQIQQAPAQHQQQQQHRSHRKRKRDVSAGSPDSAQADQSMRLSSSSSSSSDEDEETKQHSPSGGASSSATQQQRQVDKQQVQRGSQPVVKRKDRQKDSTVGGGDKEKTSSDIETTKPPAEGQSQPTQQQPPQQPEGWRVKLYRLNADGSWDDCGTGRILCLYKPSTKGDGPAASHSNSSLAGDAWIYQELREPTLCMHSEVPASGSSSAPRILLRTRILLRDAYQRQGDNIITWCEPYLEEGNPAQGVDLALSFQDNAGCLDIWRQITQVQSRAAEIYRRNGGTTGGGERVGMNAAGNMGSKSSKGGNESGAHSGEDVSSNGTSNGSSVVDVAHAVAAAHHADLQRQQQQEMWVNVASQAAQHHLDQQNAVAERHNQEHHFEDAVGGMVAAYHEANAAQVSASGPNAVSPQLPNPPSLANLEEIADTIAAVQVG